MSELATTDGRKAGIIKSWLRHVEKLQSLARANEVVASLSRDPATQVTNRAQAARWRQDARSHLKSIKRALRKQA